MSLHTTNTKRNIFSLLSELRELLLDDNETFTVGGKYQILDRESEILFLQIESEPIPKIRYSPVITESLDVSVYGDVCEFKSVGVHRFPTKVSAVRARDRSLKNKNLENRWQKMV